jgi:acyl-CoA synthetase (AMP-forming)/AMP-acid ligase II
MTHLEPDNVAARLRTWARVKPGATALVFLAGRSATPISYAQLDMRARGLAAHLSSLGARPGETRALLVYEPGLDYVVAYFGCLYAGVVAVPTFAPHPLLLERSRERFAEIARDSKPRFFLSSRMFSAGVAGLKDALAQDVDALAIDTTRLDLDELASAFEPVEPSADAIAFLQYTSGSTSLPKGVIVTHGNLTHNLEVIRPLAYDAPDAVGVSWLPPYHDMGLIGGILQPLYAGGPGYLMSPLEFLQRPGAWLEAITTYRATVSPLPNFALELCLRKVGDEQLARLDLSSWRFAINGAEPVRHETLERFSARFAACGFRAEAHKPVYGLAEATLMVSCGYEARVPAAIALDAGALEAAQVVVAESAAPARRMVGCGRVVPGQRLEIVHPESRRRVAEDKIGEIWVQGPSVARGYWEKPEATAEVFGARLADDPEAGVFLRTGDLGFVRDGELFVTGRLKDLIILEGKNYFPQDIERAAEAAHPAMRLGSSAAFAVDDGSRERVVLVAEVEPAKVDALGAVLASVRREVRAAVGVDVGEVVLIAPRTLPKTSSGKVRRFQSRAAYLGGALVAVPA